MTLAAKVSGYLADHPVCVAALGIGPLVAGSHTFRSSALIGCSFALVLLLSAVSLSILRNLVPHRSRLVFMLLLSSTWVTILDLLLQMYAFDLRMQTDIYIPLMAMNSLVLMLMEKEALITPVIPIALRALTLALVPVAISLANGLLREWLANGSLTLFDTAAGAFIITGCLFAALNIVAARTSQRSAVAGGAGGEQ